MRAEPGVGGARWEWLWGRSGLCVVCPACPAVRADRLRRCDFVVDFEVYPWLSALSLSLRVPSLALCAAVLRGSAARGAAYRRAAAFRSAARAASPAGVDDPHGPV